MKRVGIFFTSLAVFAALGWVAGYDYDTRGFMVAWISFVAIVLSFIVAIMYDL